MLLHHRVMRVAEYHNVYWGAEYALKRLGQAALRRELPRDGALHNLSAHTGNDEVVHHGECVSLQLEHALLFDTRVVLEVGLGAKLDRHHRRDALQPVEARGYVYVTRVEDKLHALEGHFHLRRRLL